MLGIAVGRPAAAQVAAHYGGVETTLVTGIYQPYGLALDKNGNIFVALPNLNQVVEVLAASGYTTVNSLGSGFHGPNSVAVDASGNVFVADTGNNAVKEILAAGGYTAVNTLAGGFNDPDAVALDASGNLYVADSFNHAVKEILAASGYTTVNTLSTAFTNPIAVAVDASGDVFVSDPTTQAVSEILAVNGSIPANPAIQTLGVFNAGTNSPFNLAVDARGDVYVGGNAAPSVYEIVGVNGSFPANPTILSLGSDFGNPSGVALDGSGNVFVADTFNNRIAEINLQSAIFGPIAVGQSSSATLTFNFDSAGTIGTPAVLTQGASGLDFTDVGTGTCTTQGTSHAYNAGDSCTVVVNFTPKSPGTRYGAATLSNSSGTAIATAYITGTGTGPQVVMYPGAQTSIGSGLNGPYGLKVDAVGNVYIADAANNRVLKETFSGGTYTQSTVGYSLGFPSDLAVDGAGNVYIADSRNNRVLMEAPSGGSYTQSVVATSGLYLPQGMAVDGSGNLYISDHCCPTNDLAYTCN